jgi:spermidine/putrescine transport system substrate-binding protein/spermidine/putrescine transport system permease protein
LAYKFIDFIYRADIAKRNIEYILAIIPNKEAVKMLPENMKNNNLIVPDTNILNKCEIINYLEHDIYNFYIKIWDELKATK